MNLRFITGIRWYKGLLETLNNMTFIYDTNWNPNNSVKATFPVCFFHVKSMHEAMTSEVSQKQMLFYNSTQESTNADASAGADPKLSSGLLNVVADNIVIKPKVYKLDVVIPYHNLTLLDQSFVYNTQTLQAVTTALVNKGNVRSNLGTIATLSQPYFQLIRTLVRSLVSHNYDNNTVNSWITGVTQQPDFNKESLEAMWRMRHILKMKVWNSWRYKYVSLIDIDITKEGTEDGVYEATLTLQEMPIVSMYAEGAQKRSVFEFKNPLMQSAGKAVINTLDKASGVLGSN